MLSSSQWNNDVYILNQSNLKWYAHEDYEGQLIKWKLLTLMSIGDCIGGG